VEEGKWAGFGVERNVHYRKPGILRRRIGAREESGAECERARIRGLAKCQIGERPLRKKDRKGTEDSAR